MRGTDVVGYAYEAAHHCPECANKRFNGKEDEEGTEDSEGNPVHAVFASDEGWTREACDDCGECLDENYRRMLDSTEVFELGPADFANADAGSWQADLMKEKLDVDYRVPPEEPPTQEECDAAAKELAGWYWWTCLPGCMPDSDADGPYASEEEAFEACCESYGV
jgi:hypothetical protein